MSDMPSSQGGNSLRDLSISEAVFYMDCRSCHLSSVPEGVADIGWMAS